MSRRSMTFRRWTCFAGKTVPFLLSLALVGCSGLGGGGSSPSHSNFALSIDIAGAGNGTVTSSPAGFNCTSHCSANVPSGSKITLAATPVANATFAGWSGACSGSGSCVVTMDTAKSVTARFDIVQFTLQVLFAGGGTGGVTSSPPGIVCSANCSTPLNSGAQVTLTAAPSGGSVFSGWSGACSGTGPCALTIDVPKSVTATFAAASTAVPLTVTLAGSGQGSVRSVPAAIDCGPTCSAPFALSTPVTLAATVASGSTFGRWSGDCSGPGPCQVTMNAGKSVTATFNLIQYALTVSLNGSGSGKVQSAPAGIACPGTCFANFDVGAAVTLTATPSAGSVFAGWGGACSGLTTCSVTLSAVQTVNATFN